MSFIEIIDDNAEFVYHPKGADGQPSKAWTKLRKMPLSERRRIGQKFRSTKFIRGQRVDDFNQDACSDALIDACILDWGGVIGVTPSTNGGEPTKVEVECTTENKLRLPETTKVEILGVCGGVFVNDDYGFGGADVDPPSSARTSNG